MTTTTRLRGAWLIEISGCVCERRVVVPLCRIVGSECKRLKGTRARHTTGIYTMDLPQSSEPGLRERALSVLNHELWNQEYFSDRPDRIAELERGVYNWVINAAIERGIARTWRNAAFRSLYADKLRSVASNADSNSYIGNVRLSCRLRDGEFRAVDVASMPCHNVFPEIWQSTIEAKMKRDAQLGESTVASMTDQFKCRKCKKRETIYYEVQTRSADEPMDLRIYCLNCGNRWRM